MLPGEDELANNTYPSPQMPKSDIKQLYVSSNVVIKKMSRPSLPEISNEIEAAKKKKAATSPPPPQDVISAVIGDFGIWQLRSVLIIFLCKIPAAWFMACIIFTAPDIFPRTEFECDTNGLNENQSISTDQCYIEEKIGESITKERCKNFIYNSAFQSLNMEFDLVCFRNIFVAWTQYWHLFGVLVGGVVGSKMTLWISPRNSYFLGMLFQIILGVATGYARDLTLHCIFRFLAAVCCAIMFTTGQAIFIDLIGGAYRWGVVMLYDTFWSIGVILLPGVSSFYNNWTILYLGITFPTLILILLLQWTPESPRWLLKNGRPADVDRVERMIRKAAHINDRECKIPHDFRHELETLREKLRKAPPPAAWVELWRGHYRAKTHMIAAHLALAVYVTNFMGLLLNIRSFGRDYRVVSTVTVGFCEIVGIFLAIHLKRKHDKIKWQIVGALNIIGGLVGCLGWLFSRNDMMDSDLKVTLWLVITAVPKTTVATGQTMMLACVAELLPMPKKMPFMFSAVTWARIWLLSAPFINVLKKFDTAMSLNFFAVLIIIGGICTCLLKPVPPEVTPVVKQAQPLLEKDQSPLQAAVWVFDEEKGTADNTLLDK